MGLCRSGQIIPPVRLAFHILPFCSSSIQSFGNPSQLPRPLKSTYGDFAEYFVSTFAPQIFNAYLHQVELFLTSQEWLSSKCQYQIFQFFTEWYVIFFLLFVSFVLTLTCRSVKTKSTWILIKPHFESLVSTFIYPQLSFNDSRKALWEDDPVDYVRMCVGKLLLIPYFSSFVQILILS